jgi:hypothetical protein
MESYSLEYQIAPKYYSSSLDFGPSLRLGIPKLANIFALSGEAYPAPNLSNPTIYNYHKLVHIEGVWIYEIDL